MRSREDLAGAEAKIEAFLTSLFVDGTRGEGRTLNLRLRRPTLYPIELLAQVRPIVGQRWGLSKVFFAPLSLERNSWFIETGYLSSLIN